MFVVVHFSFDMKSLKKLVKSGGKLTLVEAWILFVAMAVSTFLVCKALDTDKK